MRLSHTCIMQFLHLEKAVVGNRSHRKIDYVIGIIVVKGTSEAEGQQNLTLLERESFKGKLNLIWPRWI